MRVDLIESFEFSWIHMCRYKLAQRDICSCPQLARRCWRDRVRFPNCLDLRITCTIVRSALPIFKSYFAAVDEIWLLEALRLSAFWLAQPVAPVKYLVYRQ